jgi:hypothetical protein
MSASLPESGPQPADNVSLMQSILLSASHNPNLIPTDFMAYVLDWLQVNPPQIPISQVFGFPNLPRFTTGPISSGPPLSPRSGDIWIATGVDANGTRWQFQYNSGSASTYKWEFVGGGAMIADGGSGNTASAAYAALTTPVVVPSFVLARAGDYIVEWGAFVYCSTATLRNAFLCPDGAGFVSVDTGAIIWLASTSVGEGSSSSKIYLPGESAGGTLSLKARVSGDTAYFSNIFMSVVPVRVA